MSEVLITFPESTQRYFELQCNAAYPDYAASQEVTLIKDFLDSIPAPRNCLDIGAGLGRISVYLNKCFSWKAKYWLMDGNSGTTQIAGMHYESKQSFYNSMSATKDFCTANGLTNFELINMESPNVAIPQDTFDLCYSCKAIGFHWPIKDYLDTLSSAAKIGSHWFLELRSKDRNHYEEEIRWQRACRFTDWQLSHLETNPQYKILETKSSVATFMVIFKKVR